MHASARARACARTLAHTRLSHMQGNTPSPHARTHTHIQGRLETHSNKILSLICIHLHHSRDCHLITFYVFFFPFSLLMNFANSSVKHVAIRFFFFLSFTLCVASVCNYYTSSPGVLLCTVFIKIQFYLTVEISVCVCV